MKVPPALSLLLFAVVVPAAAHPLDPHVKQREALQAHRIARGVHSGALTMRETTLLAAQQRAIRREEAVYKGDGVLTRRERADLHRDLDVASRTIWREKHDAQRRF